MKTLIMVSAISIFLGNNTQAQTSQDKEVKVYNKVKYEIIDTTGFYLYSSQQPVLHVKGAPRFTTAYFFSTDNNNIQPLTIENLKKAFPSVPAFHYALDAHFRSDEELMAWDHFQHVYKIKYLLKTSSN